MLSVNGIYEDGKVRLLEKIPSKKRAKVIITILEEEKTENTEKEVDPKLFDDLVGVISVRNDGSVNHDQYLTSEGRS